MPINSNYNEEAIVEAIATALDNFYTVDCKMKLDT